MPACRAGDQCDLRALAGEVFLVGEGPADLRPGFRSTGTLAGDIPEQALVVETGRGSVVVTGCAHPGIADIARLAVAQTGRPIHLLVGGYHLMDASPDEVEAAVTLLDRLGVRYLMPTHCSGEAATRRMAQRFTGRFLAGGTGRLIGFNAHGDLVSGE